ncbi:hypothetical protein ACLOJK_018699 [Asimina triloba]
MSKSTRVRCTTGAPVMVLHHLHQSLAWLPAASSSGGVHFQICYGQNDGGDERIQIPLSSSSINAYIAYKLKTRIAIFLNTAAPNSVTSKGSNQMIGPVQKDDSKATTPDPPISHGAGDSSNRQHRLRRLPQRQQSCSDEQPPPPPSPRIDTATVTISPSSLTPANPVLLNPSPPITSGVGNYIAAMEDPNQQRLLRPPSACP